MSNKIMISYRSVCELGKDGSSTPAKYYECLIQDSEHTEVILGTAPTFQELTQNLPKGEIFQLLFDGTDPMLELYYSAERSGGLEFCGEWIEFQDARQEAQNFNPGDRFDEGEWLVHYPEED